LGKLIAMAHIEAGKAWELGATEAQMKDIQQGIRKSQWRWDFVVASHGGSFHAPLESSRIITAGTDIIQSARIDLARLLASLGHNRPVDMPDFTSKAALQAYIGLDIEAERKAKNLFLEQVVPQWMRDGKAREAQMEIKSAGSR